MIEAYISAFRKRGLSALAGLSDDDQALVASWAQEVIDQYGTKLKEYSMKINDATDLPHPKEIIKIAIKTLIPVYVLKEMDESVSLLKDRYVLLSTFQQISPEDKSTFFERDRDKNQSEAQSNTSFIPIQQKFIQLVLSEEKILLEDIDTYLNDL